MSAPPVSWLLVWMSDLDPCRVALEEEPRIDVAVSQWVESGKTRDTLLSLATPMDNTFRVLASAIVGWMESTPASRAAEDAIEAMIKAESPGWKEGE